MLEGIFVLFPDNFNSRYRPESMGFSTQITQLFVNLKPLPVQL